MLFRITFLLTILYLLIVINKCRGDNLPFVVGGIPAVWGEFPSTVSIDTPFADHCGGVIVDPNHVVTSAGCVLTQANLLINSFWLRVIAGEINIMIQSATRVERNITQIYVHNQYNSLTLANDIAVLRLSEELPFPHNTIEPATITNRIWPAGTVCRFGGWGATTAVANAAINPVLSAINSPILTNEVCNGAQIHNGQVSEQMICAGQLAAGPGVCNGNRGSGLFCNGELTGILSFGLQCGTANRPGVYTSTRVYNDWIIQQTYRTDFPLPGSNPTLS